MAENGAAPKVDVPFAKRLKKLHDNFQAGGEGWNGATSLALLVGDDRNELSYVKSRCMQLWLFGYHLPDTLLVLTPSELHIVTGSKRAVAMLQGLAEALKEEAGLALTVHRKPKNTGGEDEIALMLDAVSGATDPAVLGSLIKEKQAGKVAEAWAAALESRGMLAVDIAAGIAETLGVKDAVEIMNIKKAALLAAKTAKVSLTPKIEEIVDSEKKVKHSALAEQAEADLTDPVAKLGVKLKKEVVDAAYPPIIQSGGQYDLKISAQSSDKALSFDVIMCSLGARYSMYCANVARTYLVDPSAQQEAQYKALLAAQEAAIVALVVGAPMGAAHTAALKALQDAGQPALAEKLTSVGFGIGLEFRESSHVLRAKNTTLVQAGMAFNVVVGAAGLERADAPTAAGKVYALHIADTVVISPGKTSAEVATAEAPKSWGDVAWLLSGGDEEEGGEEEVEEIAAPAPAPRFDPGKSTRSVDPAFQKNAEERRKKTKQQEELLQRVNEETLRQGQARDGQGSTSTGRKISEIVAYQRVADMPSSKDLIIQVDSQREVVLVPIYGIMVPFHILTLKNATNNQDSDHSYIRLNFNFGPGYEPCAKFPSSICLKELSFRTADTRHAAKVVQEIKILRSNVSQREREKAERATLVTQERLVKSKGRVYVLPDVWIRPPFGGRGRKMTGQLEAHANGFRYTSPKGETLDIMYRNIKHAFFQPAENEMITLVHFSLRDPIMVGKKKTGDVQFYTEVMESVQTLDTGRRSAYDPDELEEEQRERDMRSKINKQYQSFVKRVTQEVWERDFGDLDLDFEIPFRELGFHGVPHRTTAFVMPTVTCLVELIEMPFTCVGCADILCVNLERVGFNLRNFDMAVIFKDLTRDVLRIDAIPSTSLDGVREWLTSMDIKFYENKINLNWKPILKSILEDPEGFIADGGWDFLDAEGGSASEGEEGSEDGDEQFQPEEEEDDDDDDSSEEEDSDESVVESDGDDDDSEAADGELDSEEEEGLDWDELEARAAREDRNRGEQSDDDESRKRKGGGGKGGGGKRPRR